MISSVLYNEIDPFAAQWMRNAMSVGLITQGAVDERDVREIAAADVAGQGQRHFFAGIGTWSVALRLAGVPDDANIWTGSCPCQGFSSAGRRRGFADPRHLWPTWFELVRACRPAILLGEQVASALGWEWLDVVFTDLEHEGYSCAAADLPACGVGAPHRRQRLFFVAYADREQGRLLAARRRSGSADAEAERRGEARGVAHAGRLERRARSAGVSAGEDETIRRQGAHDHQPRGGTCELGDPGFVGSQVRWVPRSAVQSGETRGFWRDADWLECRDGKARPVEPGTRPLVDGALARVGRLRAHGNQIVPQVAAEFIIAALEAA